MLYVDVKTRLLISVYNVLSAFYLFVISLLISVVLLLMFVFYVVSTKFYVNT